MNLIGPRPVRPEIAQQYSETINGYDVRFAVKPGLLGQSQAWFSHGSSKQIRARLNYMHCRAPVSYLHDFMMIANVTANVGRSSVSGIVSGLLPIQPEKIARARANHFRATATLDGVPGTMPVMALGRDNIELLAGTAQVRTGSDLTLTCCLPRGRKVRIALTCVKVLPGSQNTCFQYAPRTDFARHMLDRYAFGLVVVPPKGAFRNGATARVRVLRDRIRAAFTPRNTNARDLGVTGQNIGAPSLPSRAATGLVLSEELGLSGAGRSHNLRQRPGARLSSVSKPALRSSGSR